MNFKFLIITTLILLSSIIYISTLYTDASLIENEETLSSKSDDNILNNDTVYAYISLSNDVIELGNKLYILSGLRNGSQFVGGYNYSLAIKNNNNTQLIINGTTQQRANSYLIDTELYLDTYKPGNYSVLLSINATSTYYNASDNFSIIVRYGASIELSYVDLSTGHSINSINAGINETKIISVFVTNVGSTNAFNVSLQVTPINNPVDMIINEPLPLHIDVLRNITQYVFNITIKQQDYGVGQLQFYLEFTDGLSAKFVITDQLTIYTIPIISVIINAPNKLYVADNSEFMITVTNLVNIKISLDVLISSNIVSFTPPSKQIELDHGSQDIKFIGNAISNGTARIQLSIIYYDPDGIDSYVLYTNIRSIFVYEKSVFKPIVSTSTMLLFLLILNSFLLIFLILIYFKKDLRSKFLGKFLRIDFVPDIDFKKKSIIVDGSNIAWEESKNGKPQIKNILEAINILKDYGFEEIIVLTDAALRYQISNPKELDDAVNKGLIKVLPAKVDADSFILRLSAQKGSLIMTNDLFREFRDQFPWIDNRRIPYTIINGKIFLHSPYHNDNS